MKKVILILAMGLLWCNTVQALPKCEGKNDSQWTNCQGTYLKKEIDPGWTRDYTGEFGNVPGKRHGKGSSKVYNKDGSLFATYVGEFKDGKIHGQGTLTFAEGDKYVGEFKDGKRHGQGTYTYADGTVDKGIFKKGEFVKKISEDTSAKDKADKKVELASMINDAKNTCKELGFEEGTEKFSDCSLKLYSQSVELAAVGVVAYNGYTSAAKVSATKTINTQTVKYISAELQKCNLGETTAMSGSLTCSGKTGATTVTASVTALADFKNPYSTSNAAVTSGGASTADTDVGYVRLNASGNTITITTCYTTACSTTTNVATNTVEVE